MDYKATPLEIVELKAGQDGWAFSAYASTYGNRDHGGDIIVKGAFDKTLKSGRHRPLLWQHDMSEPIGIEKSLKSDSHGLLGLWELVDTQRGSDAYKLLKRGAVRAMSIGYVPEQFKFDDGGDTRVIEEILLLENSVVSLGMNDGAQVQSVKAHLHCETCLALVKDVVPTDGPIHECKVLLDQMTFADLAAYLAEVAGAFGASTKALLATLAEEGHTLNQSKRQELETLLGTFPGLDAVRTDVQHLLQTASESQADQKSVWSIRLALARSRARAAGVEV